MTTPDEALKWGMRTVANPQPDETVKTYGDGHELPSATDDEICPTCGKLLGGCGLCHT